MRIISFLGLLFLAQAGYAETIKYSIYSLPLLFGEKELIAQGVLRYSVNDIATAKGPIVNLDQRVRSIWVTPNFAVSSTSYPEKQIDGFGLTLSKDGSGFSWEWFKKLEGDTFYKLQGPGKVKVAFVSKDGLLEVGSVEVLETLTLRVDTLWWLPLRKGKTHYMVVEAGSTFLFAKDKVKSRSNALSHDS